MPQPSKDLVKFLKPFHEDIRHNTLWLRDFVWELYPKSNELIYDNYNALAFGFSPTDSAGDAFCSIAVYGSGVNFGFNRGSEITDPEKKLNGRGSLYRYIKVSDTKDFPQAYIKKLLKEAYINSMARLMLKGKKQTLTSLIITKSIAPVKRRPK